MRTVRKEDEEEKEKEEVTAAFLGSTSRCAVRPHKHCSCFKPSGRGAWSVKMMRQVTCVCE